MFEAVEAHPPSLSGYFLLIGYPSQTEGLNNIWAGSFTLLYHVTASL